MKINLTIIIVTSILLFGCSAKITKEAAQIAFHSQMSNLLDGCQRLGTIKVEYEQQFLLSDDGNLEQLKNDMRQKGHDEHGADNVVFINAEPVESGLFKDEPLTLDSLKRGEIFGDDMIYGQGVAFKCV